MKMHCVKLTKKKLAALPKKERSLLLLLGHANNEINVLSKIILMARNGKPTNQITDHVEIGQLSVLMRVLIGKLHEAWLLFDKRFNTALSAKYLPQFSSEAKAAYDAVHNEFVKRDSPLSVIRNRWSFHYKDDHDLVEKTFQRMDESEPWDFYLANTIVNSCYYASELVVTVGMIDLATKSTDLVPAGMSPEGHALEKLVGKVVSVSRQVTDLFGHLIYLIVSTMPDLETVTMDMPDGPKLSKYCVPFFVDEDDVFLPMKAA